MRRGGAIGLIGPHGGKNLLRARVADKVARMRKVTIVTIVVLAALGIAAAVFLSGPLDPSRRLIRELSLQFMEDLQFKDFRRSASYHHELERDRVDIGRTIEKLFLLKPEMLDLREFHIINADVDSTGRRARVHIRTKFQRLNMEKEPEEGELILYWMLRNPDCPIGSTCSAEKVCVGPGSSVLVRLEDEQGELGAPLREVDVREDDKERARRFACDPQAEERWFMNLDSTLKEKKYNY